MGIKIKQNSLLLSHFPLWGVFMWFLVAIIFVPIGIAVSYQSKSFGHAFMICGIGAFVGGLLLKKTTVVFDRNSNTLTRTWESWVGILKDVKTISLSQVSLIVYEREHRKTAQRGVEQQFSLYAVTKDNENIYFYPVTYTPSNAKKIGQEISQFLKIDFHTYDTDLNRDFFKNQSDDLNNIIIK
jgi:hypothetical protein